MKSDKIKIGITHGDINGIGYEVILKTFSNPVMLELCTPIIYGSPKVAAYHRKSLNLPTSFTIINSAEEAVENKLNVLACGDAEYKVEYAKPDTTAGLAAVDALTKVVDDYRNDVIDAIVTAPINKSVMQSEQFNYHGHTEFFEAQLGDGNKSLMILLKDDFRVALVTNHLAIREVPDAITKELIIEKATIFNESLKNDFGIDAPRIAVLSLNPHCGDSGLMGNEEQEIIKPAIDELVEKKVICYGPYPADGFIGANNISHFDGVLAMYHDQGLAPFKALAMDDGVNFTAGLPVIRTSPAHGVAYDIAGQGVANEASFRQAIYTAIDVYRNRQFMAEALVNPLRKEYHEKRDDSDKLNLLTDDTKED